MQGSIHPFWLEKRDLTYQDLQEKKQECLTILRTILGRDILNPGMNQVLQKKQHGVYIAGGFFTPYYNTSNVPGFDEIEYGKISTNSCADVYITDIPMNYGVEPAKELLKSYLKSEFHTVTIENEYRKNVPFFAHSKDPIVISTKDNKKEWKIKLHFCYESIMSILNSFSLEPCKIAYRLNTLVFGEWYQQYKPDCLIPDGKTVTDEFFKKYSVYKGFGKCPSFDELQSQKPTMKLLPVNMNCGNYSST